MAASLRWSDFRGGSWGNIWCCPLCTPGATGQPASITPSSGLLPPTVLSGFTGCGGSSVREGVKCDSPPSGLSQWLYHLLILGCSPARSWLTEWQCHLEGVWHRHRWRWGLLAWSPWAWHQLHPSMPPHSTPNYLRPPNTGQALGSRG